MKCGVIGEDPVRIEYHKREHLELFNNKRIQKSMHTEDAQDSFKHNQIQNRIWTKGTGLQHLHLVKWSEKQDTKEKKDTNVVHTGTMCGWKSQAGEYSE